MPEYLWKGPGEVEELTHARSRAPVLTEPIAPDDSPGDDRQQFFYCTVQDCGRKFKKPMIFARHFNSAHTDLRDGADSWREFMEEGWE